MDFLDLELQALHFHLHWKPTYSLTVLQDSWFHVESHFSFPFVMCMKFFHPRKRTGKDAIRFIWCHCSVQPLVPPQHHPSLLCALQPASWLERSLITLTFFFSFSHQWPMQQLSPTVLFLTWHMFILWTNGAKWALLPWFYLSRLHKSHSSGSMRAAHLLVYFVNQSISQWILQLSFW